MQVPYSPIRHVACAIHPIGSKKKLMLLLTSYMDETGHSDDPNFHFAGMAGFVAPLDNWERLGRVWQEILDVFKLKEPFHMKDFAHSEGRFKDWKGNETKRRMLFSSLIEVTVYAQLMPVGAIVSIEDFNALSKAQQGRFLDPYYLAFQTCTRGASLEAMGREPEKVAMVYSYNQEYGATKPRPAYSIDQAGRAEQLWHIMREKTDFGVWMGSYASSTPAEVVQLQIADLFAYELAKEFENLLVRPNDPMRWGLRQILTLVDYPWSMIRLFDRKELLRLILENDWPDSENTGEVGNPELQMISAQQRMVRWLRDRGGLSAKKDSIYEGEF